MEVNLFAEFRDNRWLFEKWYGHGASKAQVVEEGISS